MVSLVDLRAVGEVDFRQKLLDAKKESMVPGVGLWSSVFGLWSSVASPVIRLCGVRSMRSSFDVILMVMTARKAYRRLHKKSSREPEDSDQRIFTPQRVTM
jgi:hypothetical protein